MSVDIIAVGAVATAIAAIWALVTKVTAPIRELRKEVDLHKARLERCEDKLLNDHVSLQRQETVNGLLLESTSALLKHNASGNHTKQLQGCADKIDGFIYGQSGKIKG